jgi:hypothetical protein
MKRIFEIFYRKRIAQTTSPLNQRITTLEAELLTANTQLAAMQIENKQLADRVAQLTQDLEKTNPDDGLTKSRYVTINLPGELADLDDVPLRGINNGCECDYELECFGDTNLLIIRSKQTSVYKIQLEVVGTGLVTINIKQRLVLNGKLNLSFSGFATIEIKPDVEDFFVIDYNCRPISQLYQQASMNINRIDMKS